MTTLALHAHELARAQKASNRPNRTCSEQEAMTATEKAEHSFKRELASPPILSALKDEVKEKPFGALTEISLSRARRTTHFIQLFLFTACLPKKQVLNLVLSCYSMSQKFGAQKKAQASRICKPMPPKNQENK